MILLPFLGVFVYLITQSQHMAERDMKDAQASQAQFDTYVKSVAERRGGRRDREGQRAAQLGRDHPGRVRRDQAKALAS